jgi:hypothetical protein
MIQAGLYETQASQGLLLMVFATEPQPQEDGVLRVLVELADQKIPLFDGEMSIPGVLKKGPEPTRFEACTRHGVYATNAAPLPLTSSHDIREREAFRCVRRSSALHTASLCSAPGAVSEH